MKFHVHTDIDKAEFAVVPSSYSPSIYVIVCYKVTSVQDPDFAYTGGIVRKHGVMRACNRLKPGLGARPLSKALFYISSMLLL